VLAALAQRMVFPVLLTVVDPSRKRKNKSSSSPLELFPEIGLLYGPVCNRFEPIETQP
jgi:hypothetical protein